MIDAELEALAAKAGLLTGWTDAEGRPRVAPPRTLRLLLEALGVSGADETPPLVTADVGRPIPLPAALGEGRARLWLEGGEARDVSLRRSDQGLRLSPIHAPGYHRLESRCAETTLAVAPSRAFIPDAAERLWGLGVQVYSIRDQHPAGFGDFGALARFATAAGRAGASLLAISPVHALFAADPSRYSPYSPSTRLFLNGLLADPGAVFPVAPPPPAPPSELIDWATAWPQRLSWLRELHSRFGKERGGQRRADFAAFRREGGADLEGHAVFEALHERFFRESGAGGWRDWPTAFRDRASPAVASFAREQSQVVEFHVFLQWLARRGLAAAQSAARAAGMPIGLVADLAVGMDPGGSHAWSRPADLLADVHIGAPPDAWARDGQDWGLTTFSPTALRASGYAPLLATLRASLRDVGGVRIDHAMGWRRLWLTPRGMSPLEGAYLTYPFDDLIRLVTLESHRAGAVVIAEDLGTVPAGFREALRRRAMLGMQVLWFQRTARGRFRDPRRWSNAAAALTTTHDLPTIAGWWRGVDIGWTWKLGRGSAYATETDERVARASERDRLWQACARTGLAAGPTPRSDDAAPAIDAAIGLVAATPAPVALVAAEDIAGLAEQPNLPGSIHEHPNWRRRLPPTETLMAEPAAQRRLAILNRERQRR